MVDSVSDQTNKRKLRVKVIYAMDATLNESWVCQKGFAACASLRDEIELEAVGRLPEEMFRNINGPETVYIDLFRSSWFSRKLTKIEVEEAEGYIGTTFNSLIFANQKRWGWVNRKKLEEKLARYVFAWREILNNTDILISYLENLFFINIAELVAVQKNVKIIKISGPAGITKESLILWDENCQPIFYKQEYDSKNLEKLLDRIQGQKEIVKLDERFAPNLDRLLRKVPRIPNKIKLLLGNRRYYFDPDLPTMPAKYKRLFSTNLRHVLYPKVHRILFDKAHKNEKYFLYPLHYEWEAQLAYREPFLNQLELAKKIAQVLPNNTYLYVKVHPHYKNADQPLQGIYALKKEKNIRVIDPLENTLDLIKKALCVIVVNSTVGYEAIALGKPLIVFGHEAYKEVGIEIRDANELPAKLMVVCSANFTPDRERYREFLTKFTTHIISSGNIEDLAKELKTAMIWVNSKK